MRGKRGFTITEILVALAIFSVVAVPLTATLHKLLYDQGVKRRFQAIKLAQNEIEQTLHFRGKLENEENKEIYKKDNFRVFRTIEGEFLKKVYLKVIFKDKEIYSLFTYLYLPKEEKSG